jgi:hypothetical protein
LPGIVTARGLEEFIDADLVDCDVEIGFANYRFPPEIIREAIWLYLRFLSAPVTV